MNDKEKANVKKRVQERIHAAKSFLKTADYLESRPPLPVRPRNDVPLTALKEEAEKEYYWKRSQKPVHSGRVRVRARIRSD